MTQSAFYSKKDKIGNILIDMGKLQPNQLERGLSHQSSVPSRIGEILISLGFIGEEDLTAALAEQLSLAVYRHAEGDEYLPLEVSPLFHRDHCFAAMRRSPDQTLLLVHDPLDQEILSAAELMLPGPFEVQILPESHLCKVLEDNYGLKITDPEREGLILDESDVDKLKDMASEAPVIKYVNNLIDTAVSRRASDIHIESFEEGQLIRLRIDGILYDYEIPPLAMQPAIISRTKLLASLDIAERRLPQDGKISMRISGKEIDLRVSTVPTIHGEGVVIRLLEKGSIILDLGSLGMDPGLEKRFKEVIALPDGIILVTGPTGSGKTTTLYCALHHINTGSNKIITIEDPVEYQLHGINQIQVRPEIGLTFTKGLRSIVRQDPDVIMIGEIRDLDTAEIAVQSSLTGHLVFSTLHTNDAVSAAIRMTDLGIERFLLASSLRAIMAQRLVRRICPHCKEKQGRISEILDQPPRGEDFEIFAGRGCPRCSSTGFTGRVGLYEFLVMNDPLLRGISQGIDLTDLREIAAREGFKTMYESGLNKVRQGITTYAEVIRVSKGIEDASL